MTLSVHFLTDALSTSIWNFRASVRFSASVAVLNSSEMLSMSLWTFFRSTMRSTSILNLLERDMRRMSFMAPLVLANTGIS